jgi:hypothetical protein
MIRTPDGNTTRAALAKYYKDNDRTLDKADYERAAGQSQKSEVTDELARDVG